MADLKLPRLNRVLLSGRITNDIELRYTAIGTPVVRFTIAVDKVVKDESGQWQNQASFIECVAWSKWAESINNNAHKGSPIIVEGHMEARSYVDKDNNNRKVVEVIVEYIQFLEYKPKVDSQEAQQEEITNKNDGTYNAINTSDEVPF